MQNINIGDEHKTLFVVRHKKNNKYKKRKFYLELKSVYGLIKIFHPHPKFQCSQENLFVFISLLLLNKSQWSISNFGFMR